MHLAGGGACSHFLQCLCGCSYFLFCINAPQALLSSWLSSIVPGKPVSCRGHAPSHTAPTPPCPPCATAVDGNLLKKFRFLVFFAHIFAWPLYRVGGARFLFHAPHWVQVIRKIASAAQWQAYVCVCVCMGVRARLKPGEHPSHTHMLIDAQMALYACLCFLFYLNGAQVKCVSP